MRSSTIAKKTLTIRRGDGGPIKPEIGRIVRQGVAADLRTIAEGSLYELDVTLTPPWSNGRLRAVIPIRTGVAQAPMEQISVVADIEPRVRTRPVRFVVPLNEGPVARSVVVVWSSGGSTSRIVSAKASDPRLSARIEEHDGRQNVLLEVPGDYRPTGRSVAVALRTDDEEIPVFSVPVKFGQSKLASRRKSAALRRKPVRRKDKCDTPPGAASTLGKIQGP